MKQIVIYYHDPVEVNPDISWTGLCPPLKGAKLIDISTIKDTNITSLFDYARPDAVITLNGKPILSIEQTAMNPSGHNIPQRFSSQVRAAELKVPSILYYPEYSRRTFSDPNVRYLNVRVPLAQHRLSKLFDIPAISVFWKTDSKTKLPATQQKAHQDMANIVSAIVENADKKTNLLNLPEIKRAFSEMDRVVSKYAARYRKNPSIRKLLPTGFQSAITKAGFTIDAPTSNTLYRTEDFLKGIKHLKPRNNWSEIETLVKRRDMTMVFRGTANNKKTDSEHPWPGYLTLLDILYARNNVGIRPTDRNINLVYDLPVSIAIFEARLNQKFPPTATYIVDTFADLLILTGGIIPGRPLRGKTKASPVLII